jgi:GT2 family glycosyltransferase
MTPLVDIVVLCHNRADITMPFLENLRENTKGVPYSLTVMDNGSTDSTRTMLKWFKANTRKWNPRARFKDFPFRYIKDRGNLGFAGGNNYAAKKGKARWILFINNDAFPEDPHWLSSLLACGKSNAYDAMGPTSDMVFGLQLQKFDKDWPSHHPAKFLSGFCFLVKRKAFERVNGWCEKFFNGDEDLDISIRLRRAGYKLGINRKVFMKHLCSQSMGPFVQKKGCSLQQWFSGTRKQLHQRHGEQIENDLFEWQSLKTKPEDWHKLGVLPNGEYFGIPGSVGAVVTAIRELYHPGRIHGASDHAPRSGSDNGRDAGDVPVEGNAQAARLLGGRIYPSSGLHRRGEQCLVLAA